MGGVLRDKLFITELYKCCASRFATKKIERAIYLRQPWGYYDKLGRAYYAQLVSE
jgi:hypothetical protein